MVALKRFSDVSISSLTQILSYSLRVVLQSGVVRRNGYQIRQTFQDLQARFDPYPQYLVPDRPDQGQKWTSERTDG